MPLKASVPKFESSRRLSKLGDELAKHKLEEARRLTPEQRMLVALELSDVLSRLIATLGFPTHRPYH